ILEAVLFVARIEVRAGGSECRRITGGVLMEVEGVPARRQVLQIEPDRHSASLAAAGYGGIANTFALRVLQLDDLRRLALHSGFGLGGPSLCGMGHTLACLLNIGANLGKCAGRE